MDKYLKEMQMPNRDEVHALSANVNRMILESTRLQEEYELKCNDFNREYELKQSELQAKIYTANEEFKCKKKQFEQAKEQYKIASQEACIQITFGNTFWTCLDLPKHVEIPITLFTDGNKIHITQVIVIFPFRRMATSNSGHILNQIISS